IFVDNRLSVALVQKQKHPAQNREDPEPHGPRWNTTFSSSQQQITPRLRQRRSSTCFGFNVNSSEQRFAVFGSQQTRVVELLFLLLGVLAPRRRRLGARRLTGDPRRQTVFRRYELFGHFFRRVGCLDRKSVV